MVVAWLRSLRAVICLGEGVSSFGHRECLVWIGEDSGRACRRLGLDAERILRKENFGMMSVPGPWTLADELKVGYHFGILRNYLF